jgi:pimeloyl-ACP methyl ester carboxylesterase
MESIRGYYFENVIELTASGYRVVVPDQIGWGKSPKPRDAGNWLAQTGSFAARRVPPPSGLWTTNCPPIAITRSPRPTKP